jgi:hypothetical protein
VKGLGIAAFVTAGVVAGTAGLAVLRTSGPVAEQQATAATQTPVPASPEPPEELNVAVAAGGAPVRTDAPAAEQGWKDGPALEAEFDRPVDIAFDAEGNLLIADSGNRVIRRLTRAGLVETIAGSGKEGVDDGPALESSFRVPVSVAEGPDGVIYISDAQAGMIRALDPGGSVRTVAGIDHATCEVGKVDSTPTRQPSDGCPQPMTPWLRNGPGQLALFHEPAGIAVDKEGRIFVADAMNHCIRVITPDDTVSTFSGSCQPGYRDGSAKEAQFIAPVDIAITEMGELIVTENGNRVRLIARDGSVSTLAGSGIEGRTDGSAHSAALDSPAGVAIRGGDIVFADTGNQMIRRVTGNSVQSVAGKGGQGFAIGSSSSAQFSYPVGVAVWDDDIYVSDYNLGRVFKVAR